MHGQPTSTRAHAAAAQQRFCYSAVSRGSLSWSRQMGGQSVRRHTCVSTKKVPCTAAAAGAPWTSFVAAVDEVARTPPCRIFPDIWCSDIRERPPRIRERSRLRFSGPDAILAWDVRAALRQEARQAPGGSLGRSMAATSLNTHHPLTISFFRLRAECY